MLRLRPYFLRKPPTFNPYLSYKPTTITGAIFLEKVCQSQNSVFSLIRMREINYPIWLPVGLSGKFSQILVFMADMKVHLLTFRREDGLCQRVGRNQKRDVESCYTRAQAVSSHAARRGQLPRRLETVYVAPPPVACLTSCVAQFRGIEKKTYYTSSMNFTKTSSDTLSTAHTAMEAQANHERPSPVSRTRQS